MKHITLLLLFIPLSTTAKGLNCANEFHWLKETFEQNDAGFQHAISRVGANSYKSHNVKYLESITEIKDLKECQTKLKGWLTFFRDGHLDLELNTGSLADEGYDSAVYEFDEVAFKQYLKHKQHEDLEGIWSFSSYKVGLKKEGDNYNGYIIESTNSGIHVLSKQLGLIVTFQNYQEC